MHAAAPAPASWLQQPRPQQQQQPRPQQQLPRRHLFDTFSGFEAGGFQMPSACAPPNFLLGHQTFSHSAFQFVHLFLGRFCPGWPLYHTTLLLLCILSVHCPHPTATTPAALLHARSDYFTCLIFVLLVIRIAMQCKRAMK